MAWNFVKRHKGKLVLLGGAVGGFIYLNKILTAVERNWEKSASKDFVAEVRKKETHFENSIRTCNSTCTTLAPKIVEILDKLLDCEGILTELQARPKDLELWKELSIVIFTRAAVEVYSLCLFVCYLRVQLLVIAGYIYIDCHRETSGLSSSSASAITCNQSIQLKYLSLLNAFYDEGLKQLVTPVREAVTAALAGVNLKDKLTTTDVANIFTQVKTRMSLYFKGSDGGTTRFLVTPDKVDAMSTSSSGSGSPNSTYEHVDATGSTTISLGDVNLGRKEKDILKNLLAETQDLLETEDFLKVLNASIEVGFENLLDLLFTCFVETRSHEATSPTPDSGVSEEESASMTRSFRNPNYVKIPLVKLLPAMRNALRDRSAVVTPSGSDPSADNLVRHLLCLDILNCYSANVYEAFCDPNNAK